MKRVEQAGSGVEGGAASARAPGQPLRIARARLNELVAARIRDYILEHSLGEGDRLPTEHEMADLFGVSRSSVREATKALGFLGILRSAPKRGLTVGHVDMRRVTEYLGFHFSLNNYPKAQLLKTRLVLERGALPELMARMAADPSVYTALRRIADEMDGASSVDDFIRGDAAFHRAILEESGIEPLVAFGDLLGIFFARYRQEVAKARSGWAAGVVAHRRLLDALRKQRLAEASEIVEQHLAYYKE